MTPNGWRALRLGDAVSFEYGKSLPSAQRRGGPVPVCGSNGVVGYHDESLVRGPGIVVGRKGSVGAVAWMGCDFWPIDTTYYVNPTSQTDARWLYYAISNLRLERLNEATGIPGLNRSTATSLHFQLPPIVEQRKMAAILSSVDNAIEKTQAVIDHIQVVKRGLLQALFVRGIPGRHTQFKQSEIGDIPTEWTVVQLEELCSHVVDCLHRTPPYTDVGYPAIRTSDLLAGRLLLDKAKRVSRNTYLEQISRLEPTVGDVFYSREGTFGLAASVPPDVELCISQRMMHFRARPSIDPGFLMWLLNSPTVYRQAVNSVGGSTVGHVNIRSIRRFLVPLPEREEQTQLAAVLNSVSQVEVTSERSLSGHQRAKRALMSVLLTGELRVTPDPEDE